VQFRHNFASFDCLNDEEFTVICSPFEGHFHNIDVIARYGHFLSQVHKLITDVRWTNTSIARPPARGMFLDPSSPFLIIVCSSSRQASTALTRDAELGQDWQ